AELQHSDVDWQLHYCSRNPESCAFRDELVQHPQAEKVHLHHSSTGTRLELARLLADIEPGTHVYTCGPEALNEAVRSEAARLDIVADTLHFEQFAIEDKTGDAFTLVLARSGKEFVVPEEMTILQVIENNKAAKVECLCREGVCGTCETAILEGEADHRDQYFSDEERASQQSMLICCSRAKGKRLVLDL
ncbi:TPA: carnitine monooxygenase subunit YeaX, partial [Escherichia coli]|nr:carnitine monooxygenase subunit YeaX [Escherichia coli]